MIGILCIFVFVVAVSGCTDSNGNSTSEPQYKSDIQVSAASYEYFPQDGSASGGCDVVNNGNVTYKKVKILLEIFDKDGNKVGNETMVVGQIRPGEEINWVPTTGKPIKTGVSASATVVGATPS